MTERNGTKVNRSLPAVGRPAANLFSCHTGRSLFRGNAKMRKQREPEAVSRETNGKEALSSFLMSLSIEAEQWERKKRTRRRKKKRIEREGRNWFPRFYSGIFKLVYLKRGWSLSFFQESRLIFFFSLLTLSEEKRTFYWLSMVATRVFVRVMKQENTNELKFQISWLIIS